MFGLKDAGIIAVYLFCILSSLLCVVYGIFNWNKGERDDEREREKMEQWSKTESAIDEKL